MPSTATGNSAPLRSAPFPACHGKRWTNKERTLDRNNHYKKFIVFISLLCVIFFAMSAIADEDKVVGVYQLLTPVSYMGRDSQLVFEPNGIITVFWSSPFDPAQKPKPPRMSKSQRGVWNKNKEVYIIQFSGDVPIPQPFYFKLIDNELMQCDEKGNFLPDGFRWARNVTEIQ